MPVFVCGVGGQLVYVVYCVNGDNFFCIDVVQKWQSNKLHKKM